MHAKLYFTPIIYSLGEKALEQIDPGLIAHFRYSVKNERLGKTNLSRLSIKMVKINYLSLTQKVWGAFGFFLIGGANDKCDKRTEKK